MPSVGKPHSNTRSKLRVRLRSEAATWKFRKHLQLHKCVLAALPTTSAPAISATAHRLLPLQTPISHPSSSQKKNLPRIPQAIWSRSEAVWDTKTSSVTHARCVDMGAVSARGVPGTLGSEVQDPVLQLAPWKAETSTGTHKACPLNRNPEAPKNEEGRVLCRKLR